MILKASSLTLLFCLGVSATMAGGNDDSPKPPRIHAVPDARAIVCYFVIHDKSGRSGYVCMDGRLGDPFPPVGETYFKKLSDLRNAIEESGLQQAVVVTDWSRKTPDGWKIRSLTSDEVKFLQAKAPDR